MSGLMNSYFYGKAGQADFTPDQLPKNRLELFFTVLRARFGKLVQLNLLYDLFCLPMLIWTAINYQAVQEVLAADAAADTVLQALYSYGFMYLLLLIPCLAIMGVGSAGQMYVLRNWARDQHSFMMSDFKDSLRENWKKGLLFGLINGISLFVVYIGVYYYNAMASTNLFFVVPEVFVVLAGVIWWMMNMLTFPMAITYEMSARDILRNASLMVVARLPWSVLFLAITLLLPFLLALLIPSALVLLVLVLYFLLLGFSVTGLIYASYANACFDRFLNPRIEGAQVGQGLRDPALDYLDEEEEEEIRREADSMK